MSKSIHSFDEELSLYKLKHYLPAQNSLKDFVHHNTLHAFQELPFHYGLQYASEIFGYKVYLTHEEYKDLYQSKRISKEILHSIIEREKGPENKDEWLHMLFHYTNTNTSKPRIGYLRSHWKWEYYINLDATVHPALFRILCSFLDQGISIARFPVSEKDFFESMRELDKKAYTSFFSSKRAKQLLHDPSLTLTKLLTILVGDETLFEQYIFDQQFAHQGWSGLVSAIEDNPSTLLDPKIIAIKDLIKFEMLLEIDTLDSKFDENWKPLGQRFKGRMTNLFAPPEYSESQEILKIWQEAFEWSYYDQVLAGILLQENQTEPNATKSFQALFCIDDRECSLRRYIEKLDKGSETFGTPGFFGVEFFYKPTGGKFLTKLCPAPMSPKYLIKETSKGEKYRKDAHFTKHSHSLLFGWIIAQTLGFWAALKLFLNVLKPSMSPATASSFNHMNVDALLSIENKATDQAEDGLQVGFTLDEMAQRVGDVLKSIGLVKDFAPLVYIVSHGSSSVNNPHYAAYDCGACSGRPGSVNAKVFAFMANHKEVRKKLIDQGIHISKDVVFMAALHDTSRDEMVFFDESLLNDHLSNNHSNHKTIFFKALKLNAKERSRRLNSINTKADLNKIHEKIKRRSVSLFEPRPELNHATNALCFVGRRSLSKGLFLDRRSFMNSYDYRNDPDGKHLLGILKATAPVCGGINLEYYFSRVDNSKLGAGTKLPHNMMGLIGVANGTDGDLRPGLPSQMIEVHDPVRLLTIVEHFPQVVLEVLKSSPQTFEWFKNEWIHLVVVDPDSQKLYVWKNTGFIAYEPSIKSLGTISELSTLLETHQENFPVYLIKS